MADNRQRRNTHVAKQGMLTAQFEMRVTAIFRLREFWMRDREGRCPASRRSALPHGLTPQCHHLRLGCRRFIDGELIRRLRTESFRINRGTFMKLVLLCEWLLAMLVLAACQPSPPPSAGIDPRGSAKDAQGVEAPLVIGTSEELRQRAAQAARDQRVYAPAGDNAVEYFLAARLQRPDDAEAQSALVELQPYLLIAAEQALERLDIAEANRLLALIARVDADAPALPRLRIAVREAQGRKALESQQDTGAKDVAAQAASAPLQPASPAAPAPMAPSTASSPMTSVIPLPAVPAQAATAPPTGEVAATAAAVADAVTPAPSRTAAVRAPRLLQDAQPRYPLPALRGKLEGQAEVAFIIQSDGSVRNVQLVSSSPAGVFDNSAVAVASRWRFEATGHAHASRRTVLFRLPD